MRRDLCVGGAHVAPSGEHSAVVDIDQRDDVRQASLARLRGITYAVSSLQLLEPSGHPHPVPTKRRHGYGTDRPC